MHKLQDQKLKYKEKISPFISELRKVLNPKEYEIIYDYYFKNKTMIQIGQEIGLRPGRVREIRVEQERRIDKLIDQFGSIEGKHDFKSINFDSKIEQLILPRRIEDSLKRKNIHELSDLKKYSLKDIYRLRGVGPKGLKIFVQVIKNKGYDPNKLLKELDDYLIEYPIEIDLKKLTEDD